MSGSKPIFVGYAVRTLFNAIGLNEKVRTAYPTRQRSGAGIR
jgi:hypothetical protein